MLWKIDNFLLLFELITNYTMTEGSSNHKTSGYKLFKKKNIVTVPVLGEGIKYVLYLNSRNDVIPQFILYSR